MREVKPKKYPHITSFIIKVTRLTPDVVQYDSLSGEPYTHRISTTSQFPYEDLEVGTTYAVASVMVGPGAYYVWWSAWKLDLADLEDTEMVDYLQK